MTAYEINGKEYEVDYDLDNRIIKADIDGDDVEYRYDAFGRRVIRKEGSTKTALIWWANSECAEYKHSSGQASIQNDLFAHPTRLNAVIARAVDGSKSKLQWYHKNYLDHVYAVSDDSGNILEHYRYTAFGEVTIYNATGVQQTTSQINNQILWNTRRRDSVSGYYMYKFRHYSPELGRWPSRDPIEEKGGVNLYGFVGNEPVGRWDRLGLDYHHWFPARHKSKMGQKNFNKKCPMLKGIFDIDDYTTEMEGKAPHGALYGDTPHGYVTHRLKYNKLHDKVYKLSPNCCVYLMAMKIVMTFIHNHLKIKTFGRGSYNAPRLLLTNYKTHTGNNNIKYMLAMSKACSRCPQSKQMRQLHANYASISVTLEIRNMIIADMEAEIKTMEGQVATNEGLIMDAYANANEARIKAEGAEGAARVGEFVGRRVLRIPLVLPRPHRVPTSPVPYRPSTIPALAP